MTGKTPMELMAQAMGMGGGQAVQGTPAAPFAGFLQGLQNARQFCAQRFWPGRSAAV
jgi:predicted hotdog family 3-hydroxylacyl-ACP dehydratase